VIGFVLSLMPDLAYTTVVSWPGPQRRQARKSTQPSARRTDYTQFSHNTHVTREKLACDSCHKFPTDNWEKVRKSEVAFPDVAEFPKHDSCLNCHRQQFFARQRPAPKICANCHVNVTPRDTARYLFPSLGDVPDPAKLRRGMAREFGIDFSHEKHLEAVGLNVPRRNRQPFAFATIAWQEKKAATAESTEPKSCPVCHQTYLPQGDSAEEYVTNPPKDLGDNFWLKKGTFKTIPNSHTGCFSCHNVDAGLAPAPSDCNACHKLIVSSTAKSDFDPKLIETMKLSDQLILTAWRRRESSGTYRHEAGEHPNISCLNCHNPATMNTTQPKTLTVPVRSCGGAEGCHVTATADDGGILNFEIDQKKASASFVCTKCHLSFGKGAIPDTHVKAIQAFKKP
jgi:hypothetical protein